MAINCSLTSGKYKEVLNIITDWAGKARNKSHFKDPYEAAIRILETETMAKFEEIKHLPLTAGQVGSFGARLRELTRNVESGSLDNKWAQTFWLPTTQQGKKDPVVGSILMQMQHSSFIFRHNELRDRNLAKDILVNVKEEAGVVGLGNKLGVMRADKEYARLDQERKDAIAAWKNGEKGAHDRFLEVRRDIDELVSNSYLKVADEMVDIIETDFPRLAAEKYKKLKPKEQKKVDEGNRRVVLTEADIKDALTAKKGC